MVEFSILVAAVTLGVAFGLTVFQYVVLPIGNAIGELKELLNDKSSRKPQARN